MSTPATYHAARTQTGDRSHAAVTLPESEFAGRIIPAETRLICGTAISYRITVATEPTAPADLAPTCTKCADVLANLAARNA